ncbi:tyrosine-type recombinase/integrase [Oscillospiraceae bacterium LCP25S3_F9]
MHNTTVIDNNSKGLTDELTPHICRRTFSTRLSASGASETDLIALMGHTSITSKKSLPKNARKKRSMPKRLVS